jgi:predicted acetyltransferase
MRASDCPRETSSLRIELACPEQQPEIIALYAEVARLRTGYLDRGSYIWDRVREPHEERALGVVVHGANGIEGYAYMTQRNSTVDDYELLVTDLVARTPLARARLLSFLADHRSTAGNIVWYAGPADADLLAFQERVFSVTAKYWMLRLLDVPRALEQRGYPSVNLDVELEIEDELLPENSGRFRLGVRDGRATLEPGSGPGVRLGPRALGALYSGFMSAEELERAGLLQGETSALSRLSLLFSGPAPAMIDYF